MRGRLVWNRRDFLRMAGCSWLGVVSARMPSPFTPDKENNGVAPRFAYVACAVSVADDSAHEIRAFVVEDEKWETIGAVASDHPSSLTLHPSQRFLFAINEVDRYENLPSGSVEAYAVDAKDGSITLLNRQPLSLSATSPRHCACISRWAIPGGCGAWRRCIQRASHR